MWVCVCVCVCVFFPFLYFSLFCVTNLLPAIAIAFVILLAKVLPALDVVLPPVADCASPTFFVHPAAVFPTKNWRAAVCPPQRAFNKIEEKWVAIKMQAKMHFEVYIFDANLHQGLVGISFLLLARCWLLFFENHKSQPDVHFRSAGRNARWRWGGIQRGLEIDLNL